MPEHDKASTEAGAEVSEDLLAPVRYSLPKMLAEVARDRESVREAGKLLNQEQIEAVFSSHRRKDNDG